MVGEDIVLCIVPWQRAGLDSVILP